MIELGFLNRIFGEKEIFEEEKIEEMKMSLNEIEDFISNKMKKNSEPLKNSVKKEYANLQEATKNMQDKMNILEQASYPEETYPMLIRKAVGGRRSFGEKMRILVEQIQRPIGEDITSIINFHEKTTKLINITNTRTEREYVFIRELFRKEGNEVVQSFCQIVEINKKLGSIVKGFKKSNEQMLKTQKVVTELLILEEELKRNKTIESNKNLKEIEDKNNKIENMLEKLLDSDDWKIFLEMQKSMEDLKTGIQNKRNDFIQAVAKVEKPLKKYRWSVENKILDDYVQNSFESILFEDPKGEVFMSAIKDIKTKLLEGKMVLKDSERFLDIMENMTKNKTMEKIIEDCLKLSEKLKEQKEKIALHGMPKRKNDLESELIRLKKELEVIKVEKKRAEEQRKIMYENKEQKLKELGNLLKNITGKRILLEVN